MKKKNLLPFILVSLLLATFCGSDFAVRETLTWGIFEVGFIEGQIFTNEREIMIQVLGDSVPELNLDAEILASWEEYGARQAADLCDSLGVVLDSALDNGLRTVYSMAFRQGVSAELSYTVEDSLTGDGDPVDMARGSFDVEKELFIGYLDGVEIRYKPDAGAGENSESVN